MLRELAALLDSLPADRFDYAMWVGNSWQGNEALSCGTTACAAGWATTLPNYRAAGLYMRARWPSSGIVVDRHSCLAGCDAMASVLAISEADAEWLFMPCTWHPVWPRSPSTDASAAEVASHIRYYLCMHDACGIPDHEH